MSTYIVMFSSRNKDNKGLTNYKPRNYCFFTASTEKTETLNKRFQQFAAQGVKGELSRCYISVNSRNMDRVRRKLIAELAMNDDLNLAKIESITVGLAMEKDCAATKYWLFDIDTNDVEEVAQFTADVKRTFASIAEDKRPEIISFEPTLNGYHMIVSRGFDTRELMNTWGDRVDVKRDDFTLVAVLKNQGIDKFPFMCYNRCIT